MVYTLKCQTCDKKLGTAVEVHHLELECHRCKHITTFSNYCIDGQMKLAAVHVPKRRPKAPESTDKIMRKNKGVDERKCR